MVGRGEGDAFVQAAPEILTVDTRSRLKGREGAGGGQGGDKVGEGR